ncbi:hypothetical protein LL06_00660 [Hoeflea sp. BAL378]|nr:hypothetical protein LL06_00660 [Hoeflea sp. BAL378]
MAGCDPNRFERLARAEASAAQVPAALAVADQERAIGKALPAYPDGCRATHRSGVAQGDRLDAALVKTDRALSRANGQIRECAGWYDELRGGIAQ